VSESDQPTDDAEQALLSPEMRELLVEFSSGVHRYAMYPPGHPSLEPLADAVHQRLRRTLETHEAITIGVAHHRLVVEGAASDANHPVMGDLARRLHEHQIGALGFERGVTVEQVEDLVRRLSQDVERGHEPLGLLEAVRLPDWPHVSVFPAGYDRLRITGEDGGLEEGAPAEQKGPDPASELWLAMAQSAFASKVDMAGADPVRLAQYISENPDDEELDEQVVDHLIRLTEVLQTQRSSQAEHVRDHVSTLIEALDPATLDRLIQVGGDFDRRKKLVLDASQSLAVDSVIKILEAAASASEQSISTLLLRLLKKLAVNANEGQGRGRLEAATALRENVEELIDNWNLKDPNPGAYTMVLDAMAESAPALRGQSEGQETSGPLRVAQMALEIDALGATVESAVSELLKRRDLRSLLDLLGSAPTENAVAGRISELLSSPELFQQLVMEEVLDPETLDRLSRHLGGASVDPLLQALTDSDSRALRRKIFDQLGGMRSLIHEPVMTLLADERWFVKRNMLALIRRMDPWPPEFDPEKYLAHPDPRVRREAFTLAVSHPRLKARAYAVALSDTDERLVHMALRSIRQNLTPAVVPTILNRVVRSEHPPALRALGIRALQGAPLPMARDALLEICLTGRGLLGRKTLAPRSPELLAALEVLSGTWSKNRRAQRVLGIARESKDREVRRAARPAGEAA